MRFVRWLVGLVVFAGLLLLALQNADPVTLHVYDGVGWRTPLIFLLLIVFPLLLDLEFLPCIHGCAPEIGQAILMVRGLPRSARGR